jgi:hypothetical protein
MDMPKIQYLTSSDDDDEVLETQDIPEGNSFSEDSIWLN